MSFISISFFIFYIVGLAVYWLLPNRFKNLFLLIISWLFITTWSKLSLCFLAVVILVAFFACSHMSEIKTKSIIGIIFIVGMLISVKMHSSIVQVVGISFFSFQAISYVVDVSRTHINPEKKFVDLALYISFFPQLLSGPISKAKEQIEIYKKPKRFSYIELKKSFIYILYGCFMKMVVAERISIFVNAVYNNIAECGSYTILISVLLYSIQIYCDFAGYSLISIGIGKSFGISLPHNFNKPYFATSINDFWKRWHISLTSWFRDYLYFPLGGNRKGVCRTYINILIVFIVSGLWHGIGVTFLLWGLFHAIFQIIERRFQKIQRMPRIVCFVIISLLWVLFKASTMEQAINIYRSLVFNSFSFESLFKMGLDLSDFIILMITIVIVNVVDLLEDKYGLNIVDIVYERNLIVRWILLYILIFTIIIFGIYGPGYDASSFIYTNF